MGEGAGVLVLETKENAEKRGARIYAEIAGYSATCDAFHVTTPDGDSKALTQCMNQALAVAEIEPSKASIMLMLMGLPHLTTTNLRPLP